MPEDKIAKLDLSREISCIADTVTVRLHNVTVRGAFQRMRRLPAIIKPMRTNAQNPSEIESAEAAPPRKIRVLPPHLVNRIAAGEVVERPASVVKELVENALDAGATRIDIAASAGGRNIRVADNGCGMSPEDAALAFYNHATSKIRDEADLDRIQTLGFRGEALASIGAISQLTCITRTGEAPMGTRVSLDAQGEPILSEVGCAPGTVMEVAELFYNTPARLKFLKRPATELGHIEEVVLFLAISHPEVRFTLTLNEKVVLKSSGNGSLKTTLEELLGLKKENIALVPITAQDEEAGLSLAGFASEPGVMKSSKRWMLTYVNGRHVRCSVLQKAIEAAYESLLPPGKYPLCVFFLNLPPESVDVNVHPTKKEVRYAASQTVFGFVRSGIRNALAQHGLSFDFPQSAPQPEMPAISPARFSPPQREPVPTSQLRAKPVESRPQWQPAAPIRIQPAPPADSQAVQAALQFYEPPASTEVAGPDSVASCSPPPQLPSFKVIGQLFNTYILLETAQGLMVVDQHIASERAFFEALTLNFQAAEPAIQHLVTSLPLAVTPVQRELLLRHQADFARLGFLFEVEETAVQLKGYPLVFAGRDKMFESGGLFENLLAQLEETGEMKLDLEHMIATLSCHSAVRAGDDLLPDEMNQVIERWLACQLPWTCPHGRPIAHTISKNELNHFFHRPSLPVNAL
jgi:DNA mismatch repair protein MutL